MSGLGCFVYNFGDIGNGNSRELIRVTGGLLFFLFIILSFVVYGLLGGFALIVVQLVISLPVRIITAKFYLALFKHISK